MVTEKEKSIEKVKENGEHVKTPSEQCAQELDELLKKYNCELVCVPQNMYGQRVYVPMINEIKK